MSGFFKENWKRLSNKWAPRDGSTASDAKDIVRVEDMEAALAEIAEIIGPSGLQGEPGPSGLQGIQGEVGPSGLQGVQGETGPSGLQGPEGPAGASGALSLYNGIHRITDYSDPLLGYCIGGDEQVFDMHVITASGNFDIVLPYNPLVGKRYDIKDGAGDADSATKTIIASGSNKIEGLWSSYAFANAYQSWTIVFQGSDTWRFI